MAYLDGREANFRHARLHSVNLTEADLSDANLGDAHLDEAICNRLLLDRADLRGAALSKLKGWREIASLKLANVSGVIDAPPGFTEWAIQQGAVAIDSTREWQARIAADTTPAATRSSP